MLTLFIKENESDLFCFTLPSYQLNHVFFLTWSPVCDRFTEGFVGNEEDPEVDSVLYGEPV